MNRILESAKQHAIEHVYDDSLEYKLCAVIVSGGRVLSIGFNKRSKNSFVWHVQRGVRDFCQATHAELDAVLRARKKIELTGSKIYVVRLSANNNLALARPCIMCQHVLYNYGIKHAIYSIDERSHGKMRIVNPATIELSREELMEYERFAF